MERILDPEVAGIRESNKRSILFRKPDMYVIKDETEDIISSSWRKDFIKKYTPKIT